MPRLSLPLFLFILLAGLPRYSALAQQPATPYLAVVTQDDAALRGAAGPRYYVVGRLQAGTRVVVEETIFGWAQIDAPQGTLSYIHKRDVDRRGDGSTGVVNDNERSVNAAAAESEDADPGDSYIEHARLNRGDAVTILEERGDFYLIASPQDAYVFISLQDLRPATPQEQAEFNGEGDTPDPEVPETPEQPEPVEPEQPVEVETPDRQEPEIDTPVEPDVETPAVIETNQQPEIVEPEPVDPNPGLFEPGGDSEVLQVVEAEMAPLFLLPVVDQPLGQMRQAYDSVANDPSLTEADRELVAARMTVIERNTDLVQTLTALDPVEPVQPDAVTTEPEQPVDVQPLVPITPAEVVIIEPGELPGSYDAVGRLLASSLYNGQTLPRLFRLVDPGTLRTLAYVDPSAVPNAADLLGEVVGLTGEQEYDASLRRRVFLAERIVVLRERGDVDGDPTSSNTSE